MKYSAPLVAILSLALLSSECFAQPPSKGRGKGKPAAGQRDGEGRQGKPGQGRPGPGGDRDPAQFIARMLEQFDKDGDKKLDLRELTALFTAMRERRENGGRPPGAAGPGRGQGEGKGRKPEGADGKRRRPDGEKAGEAGGDKPRRPPAE